jgi:hypothetical protein
MSDLFAAIGLSSTPDPKQYTDQKEVAAQLTDAKSNMQGLLSTVNLASTGLSFVPGIPTDLTESMNALQDQTQTLVTSTTATPTQLATQQRDIEKKLDDINAQKDIVLQNNIITELKDATDAVQKRVTEVQADTTTSPGLLTSYKKLLTNSQLSLSSAQKKLVFLKTKKEGFQSMPTPAAAEVAMLTADEILYELSILNSQKEDEEDKEFSWGRFGSRVWATVVTVLFYVSVSIGGLLGGIVLSNTFMDSGYWGTRIFYFIYGVALFPIILLYGLIKPPIWRSTIIPLYLINTSSTPGFFNQLFGYTTLDTTAQASSIASNRTTMRILLGITLGILVLQGGFAIVKKFFVKP